MLQNYRRLTFCFCIHGVCLDKSGHARQCVLIFRHLLLLGRAHKRNASPAAYANRGPAQFFPGRGRSVALGCAVFNLVQLEACLMEELIKMPCLGISIPVSFIGKPSTHLLNNAEQIGQFVYCFPPFTFSCFFA